MSLITALGCGIQLPMVRTAIGYLSKASSVHTYSANRKVHVDTSVARMDKHINMLMKDLEGHAGKTKYTLCMMMS